jgi:hypothetical protein
MIGSKYLIGETIQQGITFPGQAHFALPNSSKICRDCWWWSPRHAGAKKAVCSKAAQLMRGPLPPPHVPRYATACKYYATAAPDVAN